MGAGCSVSHVFEHAVAAAVLLGMYTRRLISLGAWFVMMTTVILALIWLCNGCCLLLCCAENYDTAVPGGALLARQLRLGGTAASFCCWHTFAARAICARRKLSE